MRIISILSADKQSQEANKIKRAANALRRNQEKLIDKLEAELDNLIETKEALEHITIDTVNTDTWAEKYHDAKVEFDLKKKEIEIAKATLEEFFTEAVQEQA